MYSLLDNRETHRGSLLNESFDPVGSSPDDMAPFGAVDGADHWAAGRMADTLLARTDYADAATHYQAQAARDPDGTRAELAAVYKAMVDSNPDQAKQFSLQMAAAGVGGSGEVAQSVPSDAATEGRSVSPSQVTLEFDGKAVQALDNGTVIKSWPAVSGRPGYQGAEHQGLKNTGPLPEGDWILRQNHYQRIDPLDAIAGVAGYGNWKGSIPAWGTERVWLDPAPDTDTRGRDGFSVHGGWIPGSAGCIDLTDQMGDFADWFRSHGRDVTLRARYSR